MKLYLEGGGGGRGARQRKCFRAALFSKVTKAIFQKSGGGHVPPPQPPGSTALGFGKYKGRLCKYSRFQLIKSRAFFGTHGICRTSP